MESFFAFYEVPSVEPEAEPLGQNVFVMETPEGREVVPLGMPLTPFCAPRVEFMVN